MTTNSHNRHALFGAFLRELRTSHEPPITQLALGRHVQVSADAVAIWEKGRSLPGEDAVKLLDARLNADGRLYRAWRESDTRPDKPTPGPDTLSAVSLLASSAQEAGDFGTWAEIANTGEVAIAAINTRVRTLIDLALTAPPADVIGQASEINRTLFGLVRGHQRPSHSKDLYAAAGATCALLAWLSGDLGALDAARVHGATAQICADMAEQSELSAWVAVARSKTLFWAEEYQAAVNVARAGQAHNAPGTAGVMLACQIADAYAKLGAAAEATRALEDAERARERQFGADSLGGLFACGPGRALNYAAACNLNIAQHGRSQAAADAALAEFSMDGSYGFGTVAQVHITKTLAYADAGDLDGAASAARPVLDMPSGRRLATLAGRLAPLGRALASPSMRTSRVAGPLREEINAFCSNSGQRALGAGDGRNAS